MAAGAQKNTWLVLVKTVARAGFLTGILLGPLLTDGKAQEATPDLGNLSLDSLSSMEITSVSRKGQTLDEAAGAIFVISSEDIRRSGIRASFQCSAGMAR
jgi:hypothetical protein